MSFRPHATAVVCQPLITTVAWLAAIGVMLHAEMTTVLILDLKKPVKLTEARHLSE